MDRCLELHHLTLGEDNYHVDFLTDTIATVPLLSTLSTLTLNVGVLDSSFDLGAWSRLRERLTAMVYLSRMLVVIKLFVWDTAIHFRVDKCSEMVISFVCKFFAPVTRVNVMVATPTESLQYIEFGTA